MQSFISQHRDRLCSLLTSLTHGLTAYTTSDVSMPTMIAPMFTEAAETYRAIGRPSRQNEMIGLLGEAVASSRGYDMATSTRISVGRRELERSVGLRTLLRASTSVRHDLDHIDTVLRAARDQLAPAVVYAVQNGLVEISGRPLSSEELEATWETLVAEPQTGAVARIVLTTVSRWDALVLIGDLVTALQSTSPRVAPHRRSTD